jgi:hypothetical protein
MLGDALDGSILSRGVAAFEDDQYLVVALDEMALQLDELYLKAVKHLFIRFFRDCGHFHFQVQPVLFPLFAHGMSVPALVAAPPVFVVINAYPSFMAHPDHTLPPEFP